MKFVLFGTPTIAATTLTELRASGLLPELIVTAPPRPAGRGMKMLEPPVKVWAEQNDIASVQPEKLSEKDFLSVLKEVNADVFVLVAFGKILPEDILNMTPNGILNLHPSLLPKHRGPSPIQSTILSGDKVSGVTIIKLDEQVDHGPILAKEELELNGEETTTELENHFGKIGGELLAKILRKIEAGEELDSVEQEHSTATFTKKIVKADGEIHKSDSDETKWRKFRAFHTWPSIFYFENGKRIKITDAKFVDGKFVICKIIPEGEKEISTKNSLCEPDIDE